MQRGSIRRYAESQFIMSSTVVDGCLRCSSMSKSACSIHVTGIVTQR